MSAVVFVAWLAGAVSAANAALVTHDGQLNRLGAWDIPGGGQGEFANPSDVAVSPDGSTVYVADTGNDRIQVLSAEGVYQAEWPVSDPTAVAMDGDKVLVLTGGSLGRSEVTEFDPRGTAMNVWPVFPLVQDIAADPADAPDGYFALGPQGGLLISSWTRATWHAGWWVSGSHAAMASDVNGNLYVATDDTVFKFTHTGTQVASHPEALPPAGAAVDPANKTLWVAMGLCISAFTTNTCAAGFQQFDRSLNPLTSAPADFPGCPNGTCNANRNARISIDCRSHLWRVSPDFHRLDEFGDPGVYFPTCYGPLTKRVGPTLTVGTVGLASAKSGTMRIQLGCDARPCGGSLVLNTTVSCRAGGKAASASRAGCGLGRLRFRLPANSVKFLKFKSNTLGKLLRKGSTGLPLLIGLRGFRGRAVIHRVMLVRPSSISLACPASGTEGVASTASGAISPNRIGKVRVLYSSASSPTIEHILFSHKDGSYKDFFIPPAPGVWRVDAEWAGDKSFAPARAKSCSFSVTHSDFSISVSPPAGTLGKSSSTSTTVNTAVTSGATQSLTLSASGLPTGASASFSPASISAGASSTLTIATSSSTPAGTYSITVNATGPYASHNATYTLTVTEPPANDFSISVNPASGSGLGASASVNTTVTSGNTQPITLSASGVPPQAAVSFSPNPINAGQSSKFTISAPNTPPGTYTITITGTGTSATHSTTYTFTKP